MITSIITTKQRLVVNNVMAIVSCFTIQPILDLMRIFKKNWANSTLGNHLIRDVNRVMVSFYKFKLCERKRQL